MHELTFGLYTCGGLVIGLMAAFAAHNRSTGWKKSRTTLSETLDELYSDLGLNGTHQETPAPVLMTRRKVNVNPGEFSLQLVNLTRALGESAFMAPVATPAALEAELVPVRVK